MVEGCFFSTLRKHSEMCIYAAGGVRLVDGMSGWDEYDLRPGSR